ncbi:ABC transporter ATP-binding protein [Mycoplasma marinum]|uniref:Peptide ABC transporter ATP-binding protein n=1 Tax=Mycoplasma marinum TaxID=1937190 RepID=A0A4R0XMG6_9MOLU|nr:peptide ABC transporter ATP-binding protein [Mycoplasma marinum]
MEKQKNVVEIHDLWLSFKNPANPKEINKVIRGASLKLKQGEILALIGESGSGKSVITSTLYGLTGDNSIIEKGTIIVDGHEVQDFSNKKWELSKLRGTTISAVFQNPMTTLTPTMKVGKQIMEGMLVNKLVKNKKEAKAKAIEYLKKTKINNPELVMDMYPHQMSGGMKQRVVIASIIACQPKILILDEPTTALDPTVQAQILDIINDLTKEYNISVIFITHDLGVVASIADRIAIMYAGQIVEYGTSDEVLWNSQHPYTWGLLLSTPDINQGERLETIPGSAPANLNNIVGDAFAPRNEWAIGIDFEKEPPLFKISETHYAKTWLLDKRAPKINVPKIILERRAAFKKEKRGKDGNNNKK